MTTTTANGSVRKTLASQIDRLDDILDGLADNLHEAVTGAVKETVTAAVAEAVHAAVLEVLTNAELQKRLGLTQVPPATTPPPPPPTVPLALRLADRARGCWGWLLGVTLDAWDAVTTVARVVAGRAPATVQRCVTAGRAKAHELRAAVTERARTTWLQVLTLTAVAKRYRKQLLVALGVGALVGVTCYLGGREVAALVCALGGFAGSLLATAVHRVRNLLPLLTAGNR